jgi:hypothetical protein
MWESAVRWGGTIRARVCLFAIASRAACGPGAGGGGASRPVPSLIRVEDDTRSQEWE